MQEDEVVSQKIDIQRYLGLLWRRRYLVLSISLGVLSLMTWGSFLMPKIYETSATVMIEKSALTNPLVPEAGASQTEDRIRRVRNTITGRAVIERVTKAFGIDAASMDNVRYDGLVAGIQKSLKVSLKNQNEPDLFVVSYRGSDPKTVKIFIETLLTEFIKQTALNQRTDAEGTFAFIDSQLDDYKQKLNESDKALRAFRERNPTIDPQNEASIATRMETYEANKIDGEIKLKELLKKQEGLQKQLAEEKEVTIVPGSGEATSAEGRMQQLNQQLMLLLAKFTEDHPDVIRAKNEIEELQTRVLQDAKRGKTQSAGGGSEIRSLNPAYRQVKDELSRTDVEIASLRARMEELHRQQHEGRLMLGRMPKELEELAKLQRERAAYQRVYDELVQKRESARVSKNLEMADKAPMVRMVNPPIKPTLPVSPDRVKIILFGFFAGIAAGVGAALLLDYFDHSYKDEETLQQGLQLPVLASVPAVIHEADMLAVAAFDKKIYIVAATYVAVIALLLVVEFLQRYVGIPVLNI